uniref:putative nuclease HARBI1 n=1 Tax=Centroberyx gerrardi TaxID=166262 RepID=UPI003AAED5E2
MADRKQLQHVTDRNGALSPALQVLISLRFYASGSFQNTVADMVNVSRSTAVSLALQDRAHQYVRLPTQQEATHTKERFRRDSGIPGIFGCIDGTHVRIQAPSKNEYLFVNRKGFHSINVQVVCDADMKLIDVVARWYGSAHDARILRDSALARVCEEGRLSGIMLGDSGYPLKKWLMTPVMVPRMEQERQYNYVHSRTRSIIERCIGVLKRRFNCLHCEIRMEPERACTIICAAAVLHNICIAKRVPLPVEDLGPVEAEVEHIREQAAEEDVTARLIRSNIIRLISL